MTAQLLRGAQVLDGTGAPARQLDVRIEGARIAAMGPQLDADGARVLDCDGLTLTPGAKVIVVRHQDPRATAATAQLIERFRADMAEACGLVPSWWQHSSARDISQAAIDAVRSHRA